MYIKKNIVNIKTLSRNNLQLCTPNIYEKKPTA